MMLGRSPAGGIEIEVQAHWLGTCKDPRTALIWAMVKGFSGARKHDLGLI